MADGDDGDDEFTIVDLVNDAIIADADAPGIAAFELFATRRARVLFQCNLHEQYTINRPDFRTRRQ